MEKPLRILIIEDSEDDVRLLVHELKIGGFDPNYKRVDTAASLIEALKEGEWNIAISDYIMPRFSGLEALGLLKHSGIDIPFIIVSGKIGEDTAVEAMKAGADDYIVKGNLARLVPAINRELREAETRRRQKTAEEALLESEEKFRAIAATATDAIIMIDEKGNISYWNPAAEKIFGFSVRQVLGRPLHMLIAPRKYHEDFDKAFGKFITSGQGRAMGNTVEFTAVRKDGTEFPVEVSLSALQIKDKWHSAGIIRDITERKQAEKELKRHQDHLEELVESRTNELKKTNEKLTGEIVERTRIEDELRQHRDHLDSMVKDRTAELRKVNNELRAEIMRRIQMEKDLVESQRFVHSIADATPDLLYLYDVIDNRNVYINPRVKDILGFTPDQIKKMGRPFFPALIHPEDSHFLDTLWERLDSAVDGEIIETEYRLKNSRGEWRWFSSRDVVFKRASNRELKLILGIAQDITERKIAREEVKNSREQLRALLAHLQSVREDERTKIAREIHDELGQSLTAMNMDLHWLTKRLNKDQKDLIEKARSMQKLVDINIQTVKRIATELRPVLLDDLGIAAALEWQAEEFQERTGVKCDISVYPEDILLDRNCATTIFRVCQETLTNVARHADAKRVRVSLKIKDGGLILMVKDDGKGITKKQISSHKSIGLIGMKERVTFLGGKIEISGARGKGTSVSVIIPLDAFEPPPM